MILYLRPGMLQHQLALLLTLATILSTADQAHAISQGAAAGPRDAAGGQAFQNIADIPGCSASDNGMATTSALAAELQDCSWKVQMHRHNSRWYAFNLAPDAADNMSVVIMARAVSGQISMALWGPGADPYRSVPTQVGTNNMEWPGLREKDQDAAAAGGGHVSIASEQQYLFLARKDAPLLAGQYVVVVHVDMGQPLVEMQVSTPSSMTQLVAEEQEALKELVSACCPAVPSKTTPQQQQQQQPDSSNGWCGGVGQAVTFDLRQWYADACHVAPNVCNKDGHLERLVLPPYALQCPHFPKALGKFTRLRHLDLSYSTAPGTLADVAAVVGQLQQLQQLHLRGIGLKGDITCDLVDAATSLTTLQLSDNDHLAGSLPACFLESQSLQELQMAGLSQLRGPLPQLAAAAAAPAGAAAGGGGASSSSGGGGTGAHRRAMQQAAAATAAAPAEAAAQQACGFGTLQYINLAGVIGDQEPGLIGPLPALGPCKDLLYLDLSGHALSGALPTLPISLQYLNLSSNGLSQKLPELGRSPQLQYLDLSFNRFSGSLESLANLPSLDWLDLSDNELTGLLPAFPLSVRWLDLSNNRLTGGLELPRPESPTAERLLVLLNLSGNKITGPLSPSVAAEAPHLSFLDLSLNDFSGTLDEFAAALKPTNQILQINLSYNRLTGGIPLQLQMLAAIRPVLVTMKDGLTPVHRILDLSHNQLHGTFPSWLITNLPALIDSCRCTIGISLDRQAFDCPTETPQPSRRAQEVLHEFEHLQCMSPTPVEGKQQIPIWQLASAAYSYTSRQERKAQLAQLDTQQQQQLGGKSPAGVIAGIVVAVIGAVLLVGVGLFLAVQTLQKDRRDQKAFNALLHNYDPYQPEHNRPLDAGPSFESQSGNPIYSASSTASRRWSQNGDGVCEIALAVTGAPSGGAAMDEAKAQGPNSKGTGRDWLV